MGVSEAVVEVPGAVVGVSGAHWNRAGYTLGASAPSTVQNVCTVLVSHFTYTRGYVLTRECM